MLSLITGLPTTPMQAQSTADSSISNDSTIYLPLIRRSAVPATPIEEAEPNNMASTAQALAEIGLKNAVNGTITAGDVDWYRFTADANTTYVIELVDVAGSLGTQGTNCRGLTRDGVGLEVYDGTIVTNPSAKTITRSCDIRGSRTIHNYVQFRTGVDGGPRYIRVIPNNDEVSGTYTLRILPEHIDPAAAWNDETAEPNNRPANAYELQPGFANAHTSRIAQPDPAFSFSSDVDRDWYRFEATPERTYVIELVDVAGSLGAQGTNCRGLTRDGVGLVVYDGTIVSNPSDNVDVIAESCNIRGSSTIHNYVQFRAAVDGGTYYIGVIPNGDEITGDYTLRILPEHIDPAADWDDTTAEPNNRPANAYELQPGFANAHTSRIAQPDPAFSFSDQADFDWYRFEATPERTYVIELVDVAGSLGAQGTNCRGLTRDGVGLVVYDGTIVSNPSDNVDVIAESCNIRGSSTIHNYVQFRAAVDGGTYYIGVIPNADEVTGDYTLRILPEHTDPNATWDDTTGEPNNQPANAFLLEIGNAYTFQAEARDPELSTSAQADFDWYRVNTDPNEEYTIELRNVSAALNDQGTNCRGLTRDGVGLIVYDPSILSNSSADPVVNGCDALLEGDVHNRVTFNSALNTTFYIGVIPNADNVSGSYTIQITR
jgi:hypothetical protein